MWMAESAPEIGWLLLVSAVETAAKCWDQSRAGPIDRLRYSKPELVKTVEERCPDLLSILADEFRDSLGVTQKFVSFILRFLPPPPTTRPPTGFQVSWESDDLNRHLRRIYGYRSNALHSGEPFPAPMCEPPRRLFAESPEVPEVPLGLAVSTLGATWLHEDTPMLLHVFEYIARSALKSWWSSLRGVDATR
jgi:hypothetical protein